MEMKKVNNISIEEVLRVVNNALNSPTFGNTANITEPLTMEQIELDFNEMQIDSLTFIRIVVALEEEFEVEIPDDYLLMQNMNCVKVIHELLLELKEGIKNESLNECDDEYDDE